MRKWMGIICLILLLSSFAVQGGVACNDPVGLEGEEITAISWPFDTTDIHAKHVMYWLGVGSLIVVTGAAVGSYIGS